MKKIDGFSQIEATAREKLKTFSLELVENRLNEFSYLFTMMLPRLNKQWLVFMKPIITKHFSDERIFVCKRIISRIFHHK